MSRTHVSSKSEKDRTRGAHIWRKIEVSVFLCKSDNIPGILYASDYDCLLQSLGYLLPLSMTCSLQEREWRKMCIHLFQKHLLVIYQVPGPGPSDKGHSHIPETLLSLQSLTCLIQAPRWVQVTSRGVEHVVFSSVTATMTPSYLAQGRHLEIQVKNEKEGTSLAFQWLRLCLPTQGVWVWSLVRELRSCMPQGQKAKT